MRATYAAATSEELGELSLARRLAGVVNQRWLFEHHGEISLGEDALVLSGWLSLTSKDVSSVRQEFTPEYGRFAAGGARGGFPSLGFFKAAGAPLVLQLVRPTQIVLLVGFGPLSGTTRNKEWLPVLHDFAARV